MGLNMGNCAAALARVLHVRALCTPAKRGQPSPEGKRSSRRPLTGPLIPLIPSTASQAARPTARRRSSRRILLAHNTANLQDSFAILHRHSHESPAAACELGARKLGGPRRGWAGRSAPPIPRPQTSDLTLGASLPHNYHFPLRKARASASLEQDESLD